MEPRPFRVVFRGRNVVAEHPLHPGHQARVGFWATCHVAARSAREAEQAAFESIFNDAELQQAVRNAPHDPPAVDLELVQEAPALPREAGRLRYDWFAEDDPLAQPAPEEEPAS